VLVNAGPVWEVILLHHTLSNLSITPAHKNGRALPARPPISYSHNTEA
jgi:hypothetical protein